jgi:hypothetical protein
LYDRHHLCPLSHLSTTNPGLILLLKARVLDQVAMAAVPPSTSSKDGRDKHAASIDTKDITSLEPTSASEDSGSVQEFYDVVKNPFLNPDVAAHWRKVYDEAEYECRHVFDPTLTWTEEEEKRVIRKVDWRICAWAVSY